MFLLFLTLSYLSTFEDISEDDQLGCKDNKLDDSIYKKIFTVFHYNGAVELSIRDRNHFLHLINPSSNTNSFTIINHNYRPINIEGHKTIASYFKKDDFQIIFDTKLIIFENYNFTYIIFPNSIKLCYDFLFWNYKVEFFQKNIDLKLINLTELIIYDNFNYIRLSGKFKINITRDKIFFN